MSAPMRPKIKSGMNSLSARCVPTQPPGFPAHPTISTLDTAATSGTLSAASTAASAAGSVMGSAAGSAAAAAAAGSVDASAAGSAGACRRVGGRTNQKKRREDLLLNAAVVSADKGTAAVSTQERARAGDATPSPPSIHGTCSREGKKGRQKKRKGLGNNVKVVPGYIPRIVTDQGVDANKQQTARAVETIKISLEYCSEL
eukprot:CAMPEP_0173075204 /NCGR_PEP_ID=MMETSP1102-20130122/11491_1 /TAXON_ID=49646 /ORGANISM="Geminigera sp., Strain Caron Lab Isolate" /LENGTH=200 /DNA_ID=CAMNT_0013944455 /DNA_START=645 /DNA_END=1244 /DNA_ORIENTATION=+